MGKLLTRWDPSLLVIAVMVMVAYFAMTSSEGREDQSVAATANHPDDCLICRGAFLAGSGHPPRLEFQRRLH